MIYISIKDGKIDVNVSGTQEQLRVELLTVELLIDRAGGDGKPLSGETAQAAACECMHDALEEVHASTQRMPAVRHRRQRLRGGLFSPAPCAG